MLNSFQVGGMPTRFRYVSVPKQDFSLTPAEILMATDKELNEYMSIKKYAPYKRDNKWDPKRPDKIRELRHKIGERTGGRMPFAAGGEGGQDGEKKKKLKERVWEGQPVPVRNPELVDVLLKVQDGEARLGEAQEQAAASGSKHAAARSKKGIAAYDATLLALSDAEELARKLAEAQQVKFLFYSTSIAIDMKAF